MARGHATIDLGVYSAGSEPAPVRSGRPDWPWPRRRRRTATSRWLTAVLALGLALPLVGDVRPAAPSPLAPVWTVPDSANAQPSTRWGRYAVSGQSLYLAVSIPGAGWSLLAYRLGDGVIQWRAPLDGMAHEVGVRVIGGVPVVTTRSRFPAHTSAYDPDTGRLRWHHAGYPEAAAGGRVLLRESAASRLTALDLRTGRRAWTRPLGVDQQVWGYEPADDRPYLLTFGGDGRLTRRDLESGEVVASARAALPVNESLLYIDDRLVLVQDTSGAPSITAYDASTLVVRWRLRNVTGARPCGPVVCVQRPGGPLAGIDPVTGAIRWSLPCFPDDPADADPVCAVQTRTLERPDVLWVGSTRATGASAGQPASRVGSWMVDPQTGRQIADLGGWRPAWRLDESTLGASWTADRAVGSATEQPQRRWLARIPTDPPRAEPLGSIETQWWLPQHQYIVSWDHGVGLRVWRID